MSESDLHEQICVLAKSLFDRGLTYGSIGNISARTEDGGLLVSPTGTSFGPLDPGRLSRFDAGGNLISGDKPTKEMPLRSAFYDTRSTAGAVVHLHSCHSVAWSIMPDADADNFLPPLTSYGIMKLGKVKLLPFFLPDDPAMGEAVRGLAGKRARSCLPITARWSRARISRPLAMRSNATGPMTCLFRRSKRPSMTRVFRCSVSTPGAAMSKQEKMVMCDSRPRGRGARSNQRSCRICEGGWCAGNSCYGWKC
ncbi:UNVERIFIED_CONTAM: hypothetical protein GTU68_019466 [Idotea baltica]|nr:hypothetical protein [Idotea baltica]